MKDGQWYWIAEPEVQRFVPEAVGTFWGCGPADWMAPVRGKETGRDLWKRPLATDDDGVPDAALILGAKSSPNGQTEFLTQPVGYPTTEPAWRNKNALKGLCPRENVTQQRDCAESPDAMAKGVPRLVAIVGHRLNGKKGTQKRIQFSCQWNNDTETWENEDEIQRKYNSAVLTYWQSDVKARRSCKVSEQCLQILGHTETRTGLFLKAQMVGRSSCDGCAACGDLPCRESSTCRPNAPSDVVDKMLHKWPETTAKYLEGQGLACYIPNFRVTKPSRNREQRFPGIQGTKTATTRWTCDFDGSRNS